MPFSYAVDAETNSEDELCDAKTSYAVDAETNSEGELCIEHKFEPWFWEKIQQLKSNQTTANLPLIIRLVSDQNRTGMLIEDLKSYATSFFTEHHNATVYYICKALPVIMAKVPITEAENIATYEFVKSIGDGEGEVRACMDISREAIRANFVETNLGYDGNGITIAILDSGINGSHPDLDDLDDDPATNDPKVIENISFVDWNQDGMPEAVDWDNDGVLDFVDQNGDGIPDWDPMDRLGHGTHVAGTAAGTGQASNYQYRGIAPQAQFRNIKVLEIQWHPWGFPYGGGQQDDVIAGIDHAILRNVDVISMSLGWVPGTYPPPDFDVPGDGTGELARAADDAVDAGIVVVVAAGNEGSGSQTISSPGDAFNVITVGAVDDHNTISIEDDTLAGWSSRGTTRADVCRGRPKPDVIAPGVNITASMSQGAAYWQDDPNIRVGNFYAMLDGTSMATPHVSGTVALMLEANPNLTPAQVKAILRQTARLNDNLNGLTVNDRGHGIIDAFAAVQMAQGDPSNIDLSQMYDEFDVETPGRYFGIGQAWDKLRFTVSGPSSLSISVIDVEYHFWDLWGLTHYDYDLLWRLNARHVWIDGIYYNLGWDMNEYLFSGPRIISEGSGYVFIRALYRVNNVFAEYTWLLDVDEMYLWVLYSGGSSYRTLMYIDTRVRGSTDYAYLPSTSEHIYYERTVTGTTLLDVGDLDHSEYVEFVPYISDNPMMWVLLYGYLGNDPDSALNGEYICDQNVVVYYQGTSSWPGGVILRKTSGLPKPRPTLTVQAGYGGTTSPPPGSYQYDLGTESDTFTASETVTYYKFDGWTLDGDTYSSSKSTTVTMDAPHTLKACFYYTGPTGCVAEGTLVTMADGSTKPVEDIKKGDQVLGYDPTTGSYMAENVLDTIKHQVEVLVNFNNGRLRVTPTDQPIFIRNATYEGWVRDPATIQVGWEIYEPEGGTWVAVTSMTYEEGKTRVYDLVLDGYQTYIANGILLMDKC